MSRVDQESGGVDLEEILMRRLGDLPRSVALVPGRTSQTPAAATTASEPRIKSQTEVTRRPMDELSKYAPKNNDEKKTKFRALFDADTALGNANGKLKTAETALDNARTKLGANPDSAALKADVARKEAAVEQAKVVVTAASGKVANAETAVRNLMKKQSKGHDAEIDALDMSARRETQTRYVVEVGGRPVTLTDNNRSYATTHRTGLEVIDEGQPTAPVIDATTLGPSTKTILKATSDHEGAFGTVNGYDKAGVSLGIIQFAGGGPGSMLSQLLKRFKEKDPAGFADALGQFGIDVAGRPPQLVCKDHDGNVLMGDAAAQFIGADPRLCAILSASGSNMAMKASQVEIAAQLLTNQRNHRVAGSDVRVKDLLTSEYANALLYDRSVNQGPGAAQDAFDGIVSRYLEAHPGADLRAEPARGEIETAFIAWAHEFAPERSAAIAESTDHDAGSFTS